MADQERSGRFAPGVSGNPGGRPGRDAVVRRLAGRRGTEAAALLLELLGGDAGVVVIDGRAVLADHLAKVCAQAENEPRAVDGEVQRARDVRAVIQAAEVAFRGAWCHEPAPMRSLILDSGKISASRAFGPDVWRHRGTGEVVTGWEFYGRLNDAVVDAVAAVPAAAEVDDGA